MAVAPDVTMPAQGPVATVPSFVTPAGTATPRPDVFFVPTPQEVVDRMLQLAQVKPGDVVYDLGCGDGRIVVTAAQRYGVKAVGLDIDPRRIREARANVHRNRVESLVTIRQQDIFTADLAEATVVTLYLLPNLNVRLMPRLAQLRPGSRIVSHAYNMKGARPQRVERVRTSRGEKLLYLWVVPWEHEPRSEPSARGPRRSR
jgi:SAM-dependent methyltransferase